MDFSDIELPDSHVPYTDNVVLEMIKSDIMQMSSPYYNPKTLASAPALCLEHNIESTQDTCHQTYVSNFWTCLLTEYPDIVSSIKSPVVLCSNIHNILRFDNYVNLFINNHRDVMPAFKKFLKVCSCISSGRVYCYYKDLKKKEVPAIFITCTPMSAIQSFIEFFRLILTSPRVDNFKDVHVLWDANLGKQIQWYSSWNEQYVNSQTIQNLREKAYNSKYLREIFNL